MGLKTHFKFNKQEQRGVFFLLLLIVLLQVGYLVFKNAFKSSASQNFGLDTASQAAIDSLKQKAMLKDTLKTYPFNPNFITDYKGYALGMSVEEIDRLHTFRKSGRFVNSATEFQQVTMISDSLLNSIAQNFKFPQFNRSNGFSAAANVDSREDHVTEAMALTDLNTASAQQLMAVSGIGDKLSQRIVKFRQRLGGFLVEAQLYDVYGLDADVAERTLKRFKLLTKPEIQKIDINSASLADLTKLVYLKYSVAQEIIAYREAHGRINTFEELKDIIDFPADKIDRLALYLSL